jgi:hypothetical protein
LERHAGCQIEAAPALDPNDGLSGLVRLYEPGQSTRVLEIDVQPATVTLRILACASLEDHAIALRLLHGIAAHRDAPSIEPEDSEPISIEVLARAYGSGWAVAQLESGARAVASAVARHPGSLVTLDGPIRRFQIGERLLTELRQGTDATFPNRLIGAIRRTQWPPDAWAASVLEIRDRQSGGPVRLAVLAGRTRTVLPDVDVIALPNPPDSPLTIRPADLAGLLPLHARYLDERHLLIEPFDEVDLAELLRRARPLAVDIDAM